MFKKEMSSKQALTGGTADSIVSGIYLRLITGGSFSPLLSSLFFPAPLASISPNPGMKQTFRLYSGGTWQG